MPRHPGCGQAIQRYAKLACSTKGGRRPGCALGVSGIAGGCARHGSGGIGGRLHLGGFVDIEGQRAGIPAPVGQRSDRLGPYPVILDQREWQIDPDMPDRVERDRTDHAWGGLQVYKCPAVRGRGGAAIAGNAAPGLGRAAVVPDSGSLNGVITQVGFSTCSGHVRIARAEITHARTALSGGRDRYGLDQLAQLECFCATGRGVG